MDGKTYWETEYVNCFNFGRLWEERLKAIKLNKREITEILTNLLSYMWTVEPFRIPESPRHRVNTHPRSSYFPQAFTGCPWERMGARKGDMFVGIAQVWSWRICTSVLWAAWAQSVNWLLVKGSRRPAQITDISLIGRNPLLANGKKHLHLHPVLALLPGKD